MQFHNYYVSLKRIRNRNHLILIFANMKLSVIIPVYNVADTLDRCLRSISEQSFRDMQIILVNDASTDGSDEICERWRNDDHRIQVISHKVNLGLSEARNSGISKAKGEYITFVDSDDEVERSTYKKLFDILNVHPDYDILEYPVYEHYGNLKRQHKLTFGIDKEYTDFSSYWLHGKAYEHTYAWNKIYRKSLFNGVRYPANKKFEDAHTLPLILQKANIIATTSVGLYYYYDNPKGITRNADGKDISDLLEAHMRVMPKVCDADYYAKVLNIALTAHECTGKYPDFPKMPYNKGIKPKLNKIIGFKTLCLINKYLHKIYRRDR